MVKDQVTITIEREIRKEVDSLIDPKNENAPYPGASRSFAVELLLRDALKMRRRKSDISFAK